MGAFKLRGAWWRLVSLSEEEKTRGVVAFSSGNHAQGIAWAAKRLGIAATIAMPSDAPAAKLAGTRALGADIVLFDRATESREEIAAALAAERGATLVPSFDDPWVDRGAGQCRESRQRRRWWPLATAQPDQVIACCGGGGLASGLALGVSRCARIVVVEPEGWDDMTLIAGEAGEIVPVSPNPPATACDTR